MTSPEPITNGSLIFKHSDRRQELFAYHFILSPIIETILIVSGLKIDLPSFEFSQLSSILMGMLGLGGLRTYEKMKGVSREK